MYITINEVIGEETIDLSSPICSGKEIAVIKVLSDNISIQGNKISYSQLYFTRK